MLLNNSRYSIAVLRMRSLVSNCMKWIEASARFVSVEESDIATLLSNKDSLNAIKASINAVGVLQFYLLEKSQPTGLFVTSSV